MATSVYDSDGAELSRVRCYFTGLALWCFVGVAVVDQATQMHITDHAELRYRQRIDATEPFPRERLRELYQRAERVPGAVEEGVGYVADGVTLAVKHDRQPVVATVLRGEGR